LAVLVDRRFRMKTNPESQERSLSPAASGWELYPLPPWHDTDPEEAPVRGQVDSDEEATHLISDAQTKAAENNSQRTNNTEPRTAPEQQTEHDPQQINNTQVPDLADEQVVASAGAELPQVSKGDNGWEISFLTASLIYPQPSPQDDELDWTWEWLDVPAEQDADSALIDVDDDTELMAELDEIPQSFVEIDADGWADSLTAREHPTEHNPQQTNNTESRTAPEQQSHHSVRPRRRWSIVVGILTLVAVALLGSFLVAARPITYEAVTTVVVVPSKKVAILEAAGLYDTLSRGQVVATAAEVFQQERWRRDAPGVKVTAGSITPSAVIKVAASGTTPSQVVQVLNDVMWQATPEANTLLDPYKVVRLDTTPPHAEPIGLTRPAMYGMVALASLFAGAFMYRVWPRAVKRIRRIR
jgi:hypothetical protein